MCVGRVQVQYTMHTTLCLFFEYNLRLVNTICEFTVYSNVARACLLLNHVLITSHDIAMLIPIRNQSCTPTEEITYIFA